MRLICFNFNFFSFKNLKIYFISTSVRLTCTHLIIMMKHHNFSLCILVASLFVIWNQLSANPTFGSSNADLEPLWFCVEPITSMFHLLVPKQLGKNHLVHYGTVENQHFLECVQSINLC
jgi:hypothetical protein